MDMNGEARSDAIRQRLEALVKDDRLTPEEVVEDAKNPESPLHRYFEWDDSEAARRYRLDQARTLIRSVDLVVVQETRVLSTVAYVRDPDAEPREAGYVPTVKLQDDKDKARRAVLNEVARAAAYVSRVRLLAAALGLDQEAAEMEARFAEFRALVEQS